FLFLLLLLPMLAFFPFVVYRSPTFFFFQADDGIRNRNVTGVQTCALPISRRSARGRYYGLMLIFLAAGLITATAETIPALLFAWEIMGATSYALIGFWGREPDRVSAGITAFLTTRTAHAGRRAPAGPAPPTR